MYTTLHCISSSFVYSVGLNKYTSNLWSMLTGNGLGHDIEPWQTLSVRCRYGQRSLCSVSDVHCVTKKSV